MTEIQRISMLAGAITGLTLSLAVISPRLRYPGGELWVTAGGWTSVRGVAFEVAMMAVGALFGLMIGSLLY